MYSKAYLISPTNSLTFLKTEECIAIKHNFTSFAATFTTFWYSRSKITITPIIFNRKHVKSMEISLETMI